ncbi:MAG TPA: hypothetical protein VNO31_42665 [Umezawaea sp.]|nr:hypothetical protein [Umezawaea sp.]
MTTITSSTVTASVVGTLLTGALLMAPIASAGTAGGERASTATGTAAGQFGHANAIEARGPGVFPHSADYDPCSGNFLVTSLKSGTVSTVGRDGTVRTLVNDPRLVSSQGIRVDGNRVLVTNLDFGVADKSTPDTLLKVAGVGSYDVRTGRPHWYVDLAALADDGREHMVADVVVAPDGTAYAVDTKAGLVFRIDRQGRASVLLRSALLEGHNAVAGLPPNLGSTSVAWVPGDLLIISTATDGLVRVPVRRPEQASKVQLDNELSTLVAGVKALPDGSLAVVSSGLENFTPAVVQRVSPSDRWIKATVTVTDHVVDPITSGISAGPGGSTFVVTGRLEELLQGLPNKGFLLRPVRVG